MKDILLQFHGSRTYIFEYDFEQQLQTCTYEVLAQGVSAEKENLQRFPISGTPWWSLQIQTYTPIVLFSLDELPPEAVSEKEVLEKAGHQIDHGGSHDCQRPGQEVILGWTSPTSTIPGQTKTTSGFLR